MKRFSSNMIIGLLFIIFGVVMAGKALNLFYINLFFPGWWTFIIIIPSFLGLLRGENRSGSVLGLIVGIVLFFQTRGFISYGMISKLFIPVVVIVLGIKMVLVGTKTEAKYLETSMNEPLQQNNTGSKVGMKNEVRGEIGSNHMVLLGGKTINYNNKTLDNIKLTAVLGGIDLILKDAIIEENVVIEATTLLGGIDIHVPDNVKVVINSTPILGAVDNNAKINNNADLFYMPTIYINATCILGGIDVK